jgi:Tol biopolymer transport system component
MDVPRTWSPEEVRHELDALEASKSFHRAPGLVSLLRFLVETELRGEGASLKETLVGTTLYRRDANFDPKADGVVRVNANRLRRRLAEHYRDHTPQLKIILQAGSYRPRFKLSLPPEPISQAAEPVREIQAAQAVSNPRRWMGWTLAASMVWLLLSAGAFLWRRHSEQHWTQRSLSGMTGMQQFPDFSPDNRRIVYSIAENDSRSSLYMQDLSSNTPVKLTTAARFETRPAWSPDGKSLAFVVRDPDQSLHVFVRSLEGSNEAEIYSRPTSGPWLCALPRVSWTPDSTEIVTTTPPSAADLTLGKLPSLACSVVAINVRTHAKRHITFSPAGTLGDLEPTVSPDGRTIAFLRQISFESLDLFLVDINGGPERRVPLGHNDLHGLAWMPDGKGLLLCAHFGADLLRIMRMDLDSGKLYPVQSEPAMIAFAAISHDGHHIAFTEYHQKSQALRLENDTLQRVFDDGVLRLNTATSPDGKLLAYTSDRSGRNQIWISDSEGQRERMLSASAGAGASRPAWSTDGKSVVYECRDEGFSNLCAQRLNSKKSAVLVKSGGDAVVPVLSADGARLYFVGNTTGTYEAYRQRLHVSANGELTPDGKPEQLTTGGAAWMYESPSGKTLYLRGAWLSGAIVAVPVESFPLQTSRLDPSYIVREGNPDHMFVDVTRDGLAVVSEKFGRYSLSLYREGSKTPAEREVSQYLDPIDGITWDKERGAALVTTRSVPIGELSLLTDK